MGVTETSLFDYWGLNTDRYLALNASSEDFKPIVTPMYHSLHDYYEKRVDMTHMRLLVIQNVLNNTFEVESIGGSGLRDDISVTINLQDNNLNTFSRNSKQVYSTGIKPPLTVTQVLFKHRATIVNWSDGTKTVVVCRNEDEYDEEKGIAMCFAKRYGMLDTIKISRIKSTVVSYVHKKDKIIKVSIDNKPSWFGFKMKDLNKALMELQKEGYFIRKFTIGERHNKMVCKVVIAASTDEDADRILAKYLENEWSGNIVNGRKPKGICNNEKDHPIPLRKFITGRDDTKIEVSTDEEAAEFIAKHLEEDMDGRADG